MATLKPWWGIVGVPDRLVTDFSSRGRAIEIEKERLIAEYVSPLSPAALPHHGHQAPRPSHLAAQPVKRLAINPHDARRSTPQPSAEECRRVAAYHRGPPSAQVRAVGDRSGLGGDRCRW